MRTVRLLVPMLVALATALPAVAAQRTFVATTGSDANACSLTAPCRSFGTAMTSTDVGGEIVVLDSGAYGRVTVNKAVTIESPAGVYAGISVFAGTNGIDVNAPGATVTLRGLSINGQGGNVGINVAAVDALRIDRCRVSGVGAQAIRIVAGNVVITDAYLSDNGHDGIWAFGVVDVLVERTVSTRNLSGAAFFAGARATLRDTTLTSSSFYGLYGEAGPTATPTYVRADNVTAAYNQSTGAVLVGLAASFGSMTISRSTIVANGANGVNVLGENGPVYATVSESTLSNHPQNWPAIASNGANAKVVVTRSTVVDNGSVGLFQLNNGVFESAGTNTVRNNNGGGVQTIGTIVTIPLL
jgi:hypothetical protein